MNTKADWHILGAGAIGGLWAMRLAQAGASVALLSRHSVSGQRTLTLQHDNLRYTQSFPLCVTSVGADIKRLIVTTKSQAAAAAIAPWLPHIPANTPVLLLQNGMGADDALLQQRPDLTILTGITTDGVFRPEPDTLVLAGQGETWIGASQTKDQDCARTFVEALQKTGAKVYFADDILQRRWQKLASNCAINALTALYRCRNGELLTNQEALATMQAVCHEVAAVMRAEGLASDGEALFRSACDIARKTARNISSTHADIVAGRETEIRFLNGYIVDKAAQHDLPVPANRQLLTAILSR